MRQVVRDVLASPLNLLKLIVVILAFGLMGQAKNCGDINALIPQIDKLFNSGGSGGNTKIFISNLSFLDAATQTTMGAGDAEMINDAVTLGMQALSTQDPKYVINDPKNTLPNTDANAKKLSAIYFDQNIPKAQKIDMIIADLMNPSGIDGLVSGQFLEKSDGSISVRPIVFAKSSKSIITESLTFTKQEFECKDPQNPNKKALCDKAKESIRDTVIRLIKNL